MSEGCLVVGLNALLLFTFRRHRIVRKHRWIGDCRIIYDDAGLFSRRVGCAVGVDCGVRTLHSGGEVVVARREGGGRRRRARAPVVQI